VHRWDVRAISNWGDEVIPKIVKRNISNDYFREVYLKELLVYHFTAGMMPGAENHLGLPDKINVPYIICKDGQINEYFDSKYYAYHTGVGLCKESIGIEIECWGNLSEVDGLLLPWTMCKSQAVPKQNALRLDEPFRGFRWFELLTDEQVKSVDYLTELLVDKHPTLRKFKSHADIRKTKLDFPPDYDQIYNIIRKYNGIISGQISTTKTWEPYMEIAVGSESKYTPQQIQDRINWLIQRRGWGYGELNRLIKYRNSKK
jgi:hypothetical protein